MYARPGFLLRRAHQISAAVFESHCAALGLTQAQYGTMTVLANAPGLDQTRLARALAFDKVTVLRVIRGLCDRGLVHRATSAENKRQLALELTDQGWAVLQAAQPLASAAHQQLIGPLNAKETKEFVRLLQKLNSGLADSARAPFQPL
ncbi:MAG: MarR family transcriptional regulator [Hydrogenophaga sp.]|nr:MarR family transcriptional regulator [Hydrogenophaga sp.]